MISILIFKITVFFSDFDIQDHQVGWFCLSQVVMGKKLFFFFDSAFMPKNTV